MRFANMNLKIVICGSLSISAITGMASAAQIVFSNLDGLHPITNPSGDLVPAATGFAQVGTIGLADSIVMASANNRAGLAAAFEEFGTSTSFGAGSPGFFSATRSAPIAAGSTLIGDNIYIVAGDGSSIATSSAIFIFKSDEVFEVDSPLFTTTIELNKALLTGNVLVGAPVTTFVPFVGTSFAGSEMVAFIPEPNTGLLFGAAGLCLLIRRSRRRR